MNSLKLSKKLLGFIVTIFILIFVGLSFLSSRNTAVTLEEQIDSQYVTNKSNYDNMWKKFKEIAQVPDMQAKNIKDIYTNIISGRYNDTKLLFKAIKEDNPKMNTKLYEEIQREISAGRNIFDNNQKKIADKIREYNTYIRHHFIMANLTGRKPKNANEFIVTSERTQQAFETKKDDEIKLTK